MIVFDTTVLVYAVGAEHPLRDPCRALVAAASAGGVRATTTVEIIQEFAHVRARRRDRADAAELARQYAVVLSPLLHTQCRRAEPRRRQMWALTGPRRHGGARVTVE